jgi:hypothetical protein
LSTPDGAGEQLIQAIALTQHADDRITGLGAAMLVGLRFDLAADTRSSAKVFDIEHALVLRELISLADVLHLVEVEHRDERTQRAFMRLTALGQQTVDAAIGWSE